ncbi:hypothetical protein J6590_069840 [Homalodisca vitripennis]|nr:hypothetical protein J6590_069840 [Homalodisca vitripennis]
MDPTSLYTRVTVRMYDIVLQAVGGFSYGYDRPWNSHHHCRSVRACIDAHRPWTPCALPRTQGYHESPYYGLPLHCCGIDHAFLDR